MGLVLAADEVLNAQEESPTDASRYTLANDKLRLRFDSRGLRSMEDLALGKTFRFKMDRFELEINKKPIDSAGLRAAAVQVGVTHLTYTFNTALYKIQVNYELRADWRFLGKQILASGLQEGSFSVDRVEPLQFQLEEGVSELYVQNCRHPRISQEETGTRAEWQETGTKAYVAFLRMHGTRGLFTLLQNPFFECARQGEAFSLRYSPEMEWQTAWGSFPCDRACLGPYQLSGRKIPKEPVPEWQLAKSILDGQDEAEVEAVTECVRAFLMFHLQKSVTIHLGWDENDYQIDIAKPDGREEYKRIIDVAAAVGCDDIVFAPKNTGLSDRNQSTDSWHWEYVLWLTLGEKIRKGEWRVDRDPVPDSIQEMLDYAKSKNVQLMAYVYPDLPFSQSKEWLTPDGQHASLGYRSLQDWLIDTLVAFQRKTGLGGYFFDYVFLYLPVTSRYSQWFGWRRVMETVRRTLPGIVIAGGAFDHKYGPWLRLAGNWVSHMFGDEQPESYVNFPDLHFDRVEANRLRYATFLYKSYEYYPTEALTGFMSHQVPRQGGGGGIEPEAASTLDKGWRTRNFDYLGWKYSVISSIGYAGFNHEVAMLPARNTEEFKHFSAAEKKWLRIWLEWTDANLGTLRNTRLILGEPAVGKADGSAAIAGDHGYIFLFNPNGRKVEASFQLDSSIGLHREGSFLLREMYPFEGRLWGKPGQGTWITGDRVTLPLDGTSATVLSLTPAASASGSPMLFNAPGSASLAAGHLVLSGVWGEMGTEVAIGVLLPKGAGVETLSVNGIKERFQREGEVVTARVRFEGKPFSRSQQVGSFDPEFTGGVFHGEFQIPARIKRQLAARKEAWPMPWTKEDLRCSWLAPERLLLFIQMANSESEMPEKLKLIAEYGRSFSRPNPDAKMPVKLRINGEEIVLQRAYSSIRLNPNCFLGYYADLSSLEADKTHTVDLSLPRLEPGRFQGLFFDNVETEYTDRIVG